MQPCLSNVSTLPSSFHDDVVGYSGAGCRTMEVWFTKLENHITATGVADARALLSDYGMSLAAGAYQGGLLLSEGAARASALDLFKRRLELCQQLVIPTLLLVADFASAMDQSTLGRALQNLVEAGRWASGYGVRIALEFRGADTFCTSLDTALALVLQAQEANVGLCLDLFHYYKGPSKPEDLQALSTASLFHVQVCDVAGIPRELMTDADRILPGEGDFHYGELLTTLRRIGYTGAVSVELMNPVVWKADPYQVAEMAMTSLKRLLTS